jgi:hypothetical protein
MKFVRIDSKEDNEKWYRMENESLKITWFTSYSNAILKGRKNIKGGKIVFGSNNLSHVFNMAGIITRFQI